jgi:hypothetical protein
VLRVHAISLGGAPGPFPLATDATWLSPYRIDIRAAHGVIVSGATATATIRRYASSATANPSNDGRRRVLVEPTQGRFLFVALDGSQLHPVRSNLVFRLRETTIASG